jgi:DNA-binding CsgD family transcriptional regulator
VTEFDLPPLDEGTQAEIQAALGITHMDPRTKRRDTRLTARELRALELTAAGATYEQVGKVLGIARTNARHLVERALARRAAEVNSREFHVAKALELDRLETLYRRWWPLAIGNPAQGVPPLKDAADMVLKIHDRVARIEGLNAPTQVEARIDLEVNEISVEERRARVLSSLAEVRARQLTIEGEFREVA